MTRNSATVPTFDDKLFELDVDNTNNHYNNVEINLQHVKSDINVLLDDVGNLIGNTENKSQKGIHRLLSISMSNRGSLLLRDTIRKRFASSGAEIN